MNDNKKMLFVEHIVDKIVDGHRKSFEDLFDTVKKNKNGGYNYGYLHMYTYGTPSRHFMFDFCFDLNKEEFYCDIRYCGYNFFGFASDAMQSFDVNQIKSITSKAVFEAVDTILSLRVEKRSGKGSRVYYRSASSEFDVLPGIYPAKRKDVIKMFLTYLSKEPIKGML